MQLLWYSFFHSKSLWFLIPPTRRNLQRRMGPSIGNHLRPERISPPQFFKLMLQSTILDRKLLLPEEFSTEFGDELSAVATLKVPNGCTWRVGIKKSCKDNVIWFHDGWHEFVEYYSIDFGYSLVFRYEGNSKFHVMIFNNVSGYQIEYPSDDLSSDLEPKFKKQNEDKTEDESDESVEILDVKPFMSHIGSSKLTHKHYHKRNITRPLFDSPILRNSYEKTRSKMYKLDQSYFSEFGKVDISRKGKQKKSDTPYRRNISMKHEDGEDFFLPRSLCQPKKRRFVRPEDSKKAIQAATMYKLENPSFMITLKPHNKSYVYVPADFSRKYLQTCPGVLTLEAPNGEKCNVVLFDNDASYSKRLIKGWGGFMRDNDLDEGDVCVFELINRKIIVLKVWIYRVADYAGW